MARSRLSAMRNYDDGLLSVEPGRACDSRKNVLISLTTTTCCRNCDNDDDRLPCLSVGIYKQPATAQLAAGLCGQLHAVVASVDSH